MPTPEIFGLEVSPEDAALVLVPVPFDATVSYGEGTSQGPAAILQASPQLDLFDLEAGEPHLHGLAMLEIPREVQEWSDHARELARPVVDAGDAEPDPALEARRAQVNDYGQRVNAWVRAQVELWQGRGKLVGIVGGDHSVPFAAIACCAERWPGMGILHLDAHADLRKSYQGLRWSHASIMWNVLQEIPQVERIVGVGYRDLCKEEHDLLEEDPRLVPFYDPWLRRRLQEGTPWAELSAKIVSHLPQQVYVSFDVDGLDPTLCPHTGTPVPGGLSFSEATSLLRDLRESGREIVGFDLCEVAPDPQGLSEFDGNVGARLLYKLAGFALCKP